MTLLLIVTAIASLGEPLLVILAVIGVLYFLFKLLGCLIPLILILLSIYCLTL